MNRWVCCFIGAMVMQSVCADSQGDQYYRAVDWAKSTLHKTQQTPGYRAFTPLDYRQDEAGKQALIDPPVVGNDPDGLRQKAAQASVTDPYAQVLQRRFNHAPVITLTDKVPSLQQATQVMQYADEIVHGQPSPYTDGTGDGEQQGGADYTTVTCQAPNVKILRCYQYPVVVGSHTEEGRAYLGRSDLWFDTFTVALPYTGGLTIKRLQVTIGCSTYSHIRTFSQARLIGITGRDQINMAMGGSKSADVLVNTYVPGNTVTLRFDRRIHLADFAITWERNVADIKITNTCGELSKHCRVIEKVCEESGGTRIINNLPVTLPCWKERQVVQCGTPCANTCTPYETHCQLLRAECAAFDSDWCLRFTKTYRCENQRDRPKRSVQGIASFGIDGDFYVPNPQINGEFGKAGSRLAGVGQAAASMTHNPPRLFAGVAMHCNKAMAGYADCCKESGWGKDLGLAHCSPEEQTLGKAKTQGRVVDLGEYCAERVAGVCIRRKRGACVFDSSLARLIQEQGRQQLGIGMGSAERPDCRGLTPEELQRIDFSKMDFSAVYPALLQGVSLPDAAVLQQRIQQQLERWQ